MPVPNRTSNNTNATVSIGIDAAVVAPHQVATRGNGIAEDFRVPPTLAGMTALTERLRPYAGALVVAEPTGGTWLPLSVAVRDADCRIGFCRPTATRRALASIIRAAPGRAA